MSELLWVCEKGAVYSSAVHGLNLTVSAAPSGGGYRFQLVRPGDGIYPSVAIASGYRDDVRGAIAAAERTAQGFAAQPRRDTAKRA